MNFPFLDQKVTKLQSETQEIGVIKKTWKTILNIAIQKDDQTLKLNQFKEKRKIHETFRLSQLTIHKQNFILTQRKFFILFLQSVSFMAFL